MFLVSFASLMIGLVAVIIAYFRYKEYRNSVQRTLYSELVGEEYEFKMADERNIFTIENVDVGGGWRPSTWTTMVLIEFDLDQFPWDQRETRMSEKVVDGLLMLSSLLAKNNPDTLTVDFFISYNAPAMAISFPTTNLYDIKEFMRRTQHVIGNVLEHYEEYGTSMKALTKLIKEHLEVALYSQQKSDEDE